MSATVSKTRTWPSMTEVDALVRTVQSAVNAVDVFSIRMYGLVEREMEWERPSDVPVPTLEDVGALTRLAVELEHRIESLEMWRDDFRQARDSASAFESYARLRGAS